MKSCGFGEGLGGAERRAFWRKGPDFSRTPAPRAGTVWGSDRMSVCPFFTSVLFGSSLKRVYVTGYVALTPEEREQERCIKQFVIVPEFRTTPLSPIPPLPSFFYV